MNCLIKIRDIDIPLCIKNYKTSKSIKLYFKEGVLTITKSPYIPKKEVDKLIRNNEEKIYQEYKKILDIKRLKEGRWNNGKEILYNGEIYIIQISYYDLDIIKIKLDKIQKLFIVLLPGQILKEEEEYFIRKAVRKLFKENTEAILREKIPYWSKETNIKCNSVSVRDAKTRYGSCIPSKKALRFTSRLVMLEEQAIDAIIVHELCHIIHPNHSKEFYDLIEKYIPNYKQIDKNLKKNSKLIMI